MLKQGTYAQNDENKKGFTKKIYIYNQIIRERKNKLNLNNFSA